MTRSDDHLRWLYGQLPNLVDSGVLSAESAEALRRHFGAPKARVSRMERALTIFGVIGAVLVALGIILLFAFNWEQLSPMARTVVAFIPVVIGQAAAAFALYRRPDSVAWREASASFLFLAIGACTALISQTWQIGGDTEMFLLVWMLLGLPLVYLMDASLPLLFYLTGIAAWTGFRLGRLDSGLSFWPMAALALPHLLIHLRREGVGARTALLGWGFGIAAIVGLVMSFGDSLPDLAVLAFAAGLTALYLLDLDWPAAPGDGFWLRPLAATGGAGLLVLAFVHSFEGAWEVFDIDRLTGLPRSELVLMALLFLLAFWQLWRAWNREQTERLALGVLPILALIGAGLTEASGETWPAWLLMNAYLLLLSLAMLGFGLREDRLGQVSKGLGLLALLIWLRFFDAEMGLLGRSIVFIVLGLGFLAANAWLARRMRQDRESGAARSSDAGPEQAGGAA